MRLSRLLAGLAALGVLAALPAHAPAQQYYGYVTDQPDATPVSTAAMDSVLQRLDALEAKVAGEEKAADNGWVNVSNQKWTHKWGGRIYGDYVMYADQNAGSAAQVGDAPNWFEMRKMRLFVEGEGYGVYDYKLELDFEPEAADTQDDVDGPLVLNKVISRFGTVAMKDAYFGIHEIPWIGYMRFGHYKAPFSLEELTSSRYITFMERSLPNIFAPGREVGVTAYNHSAGENLTWATGVFFDRISETAKERVSDNLGTTLASRITWTPYYDEPSGGRYLLHVGLNTRYTNVYDNVIRFRARPEVHEGPQFIDTGELAGSSYSVVGPELAAVWGPLSVQAEYMWVNANLAAGDADFHGAYVYGSLFLTGENRHYSRQTGAFSRVTPYSNFWLVPGSCGPGAWEAAIRWSYLDLNGTGGPNAGLMNDLTLGLNWYWNPYVRWMFNYIHSWNVYDSGQFATAENDIFAMRGQIDF